MMEPLQPLPMEDWPLLRDSFKRDWPNYAYYYNWAITAIHWRKKDPDVAWKIYCPGGKYDAGAFIAIASNGLYVVIAFAFEEVKDKLRQIVLNTNLIDWKREVIFSIIHQSFKDVLEDTLKKISTTKNINLAHVVTTVNYFKPKDECLKFEWQVPNGCCLKPLEASHIPLVNSLWPHRNRECPELSLKFLRTCIKFNRSVGLFRQEDDSLVSWILHTDFGSLGMLQTVEEYKRKGYGRIVAQALVKELAENENLNSTLFIVKSNVPSEKLFTSLGYKPLEEVTWIIVQPSHV